VRRYRFPNVVDRFLVPATPEPLISCSLAGSAEFREREIGEAWLKRQIGPGHSKRQRHTDLACVATEAGEDVRLNLLLLRHRRV
jgi:hypothetical protein